MTLGDVGAEVGAGFAAEVGAGAIHRINRQSVTIALSGINILFIFSPPMSVGGIEPFLTVIY